MTVVGKLVRRALRPAGLELVRSARNPLAAKHRAAVAELEACFREVILPDLPARERRLELLEQLEGTNVSEALYLVHALSTALTLPGDVCEFGVAQGATSALIANEIRDTEKCLWLFDSFQGLPEPTAKDVLKDDIFGLGDIRRYAGKMSYQAREVIGRLSAISFPASRTKVVPGFIEETAKRDGLPGEVCFAYVDFDFYEPILTALRLLHGRIQRGGSIMVDDYDFFSEGAKAAVDEFLAAHSEYRVSLPRRFAGHFALLTKAGSSYEI